MDGVFMVKFIGKFLILLTVVGVIIGIIGVIRSNTTLKNEVIRLHIIANSDSDADQAEKLKVRDAVLNYIEKGISQLSNRDEAENYIRSRLADIERVANEILAENGSDHIAKAKLGLKDFGKRIYDTFALPSGVYEALQIEIGEAEGQNWWCVVFPGLCMPASNEEFCQVAASAGFDNNTIETISDTGSLKIRFYLLDFIGKIENFLFKQ